MPEYKTDVFAMAGLEYDIVPGLDKETFYIRYTKNLPQVELISEIKRYFDLSFAHLDRFFSKHTLTRRGSNEVEFVFTYGYPKPLLKSEVDDLIVEYTAPEFNAETFARVEYLDELEWMSDKDVTSFKWVVISFIATDELQRK